MTVTLDQLWAAGLLDATVDPRAEAGGALWLTPRQARDDVTPADGLRYEDALRSEADADFLLSTSGLYR